MQRGVSEVFRSQCLIVVVLVRDNHFLFPNGGTLLLTWLVQKNYPMAIKMYRMALDQIPNTGKEIRLKIMRNIGNAFVRLGQFQDAIQSYEAIMEGNPDFHLVVCYYALGDADRMKKGFGKLLSIPPPSSEEEEDVRGERPRFVSFCRNLCLSIAICVFLS